MNKNSKEKIEKNEDNSGSYTVGLSYKTNIGKLLPLHCIVIEIENYLERNKTGDSLVLVSRDISPNIEEKCENGIVIVRARSNSNKEFVVFYKAKFNQFGLFLQTQTGKNTFEYDLINSWNISVEEGNWFDCELVAEEE